jgi:hypothetical protein
MPISYTCTYDPSDPTDLVTQVRFNIQDVDITTTPPSGSTPRAQWSVLFTDQEINMIAPKYASFPNQADLTAAELLENVASNAALLAKHITLGDYSSDTRTAANGLRSQADWLRQRYAKAQAAGSEEPAESVSQEIWDDFGFRRWLYTSALP